MGIGASIFLIALGAILTFAVEFTVVGIDIYVVGIILMVVGLAGLVLTFIMMNRDSGPTSVTEERTGRGATRGTRATESPPAAAAAARGARAWASAPASSSSSSGAILTFAITADIPNIDLGVVGVILMLGGAVGLLVTLVLYGMDSREPEDVQYRERPPGRY